MQVVRYILSLLQKWSKSSYIYGIRTVILRVKCIVLGFLFTESILHVHKQVIFNKVCCFSDKQNMWWRPRVWEGPQLTVVGIIFFVEYYFRNPARLPWRFWPCEEEKFDALIMLLTLPVFVQGKGEGRGREGRRRWGTTETHSYSPIQSS